MSESQDMADALMWAQPRGRRMKVYLNGDLGWDSPLQQELANRLKLDGLRNGYIGKNGRTRPADQGFGLQQVTCPNNNGLATLCVCWNEGQVNSLPDSLFCAVEAGNECDIGTDSGKMDPATYVSVVAIPVVRACNARKIPVYIGAISNCSYEAFWWLEEAMGRMPKDAVFGVSRHRYLKPTETAGYGTRASEYAAWKQIVGDRPTAQTECGLNLGPVYQTRIKLLWGFLPIGIERYLAYTNTEDDQVRYFVDEIRACKAEGFELVCAYQINSADPTVNPSEEYGWRTFDGTWRAVATLIATLKQTDELP